MKRRSISDRILWVISRCCLAGGLGTLAVGLGFATYSCIFLARSVSADGKVVRLEPREDTSNGAINYAAIFAFTAADGRTYTVESGVASNPPEFEVGQQVKIRYMRSNPGGARIATFLQFWLVTLICSMLGIFCSAAGYLLFRWERRRMQRNLALTVSA